VWSLAMIIKNEEARIADALTSVSSFCDELIVVDTGSTDRTIEIAQQCGAQVSEFEWIDDFSAARNASFQRCSGDWIFWMDADDIVASAAQQGFASLKEHLTSRHDVNTVWLDLRYVTPDGGSSHVYPKPRVVRRSANPRWTEAIHEQLVVNPPGSFTEWPSAWVEDRVTNFGKEHTDRNLRILLRQIDLGRRTPHILFYLGNEYRDHGRLSEAVEA